VILAWPGGAWLGVVRLGWAGSAPVRYGTAGQGKGP